MPRLVPCPSCQRHVFAQEAACPHCGTGGTSFVMALAIAASLGVAGCASDSPPQGEEAVYGPAPVDTSTRATSSATEPTATSTGDAPPRVEVDVYGPAPRDVDTRTSPSGSAAPSANSANPKMPPATVYGPPPMDPSNRLDPPKKK